MAIGIAALQFIGGAVAFTKYYYSTFTKDDAEPLKLNREYRSGLPRIEEGLSPPMYYGSALITEPLLTYVSEVHTPTVDQKVHNSKSSKIEQQEYIYYFWAEFVVGVGGYDSEFVSQVFDIYVNDRPLILNPRVLNVDNEEIRITDYKQFFGGPNKGGGFGESVTYTQPIAVTAGHPNVTDVLWNRIVFNTGGFTQTTNTRFLQLLTKTEAYPSHSPDDKKFFTKNSSALTDPGGHRGFVTLLFDSFGFGEAPQPPKLAFWAEFRPYYTSISILDSGLNRYGANPAACLYNFLHDEWRGLGLNSTLIDDTTFAAASATTNSEGLYYSNVFYDGTSPEEVISSLLLNMDGILYTDPLTRKIALKLIRNDYTPAALTVYDDAVISEVRDFHTTTWATTFNEIHVEYTSTFEDFQTKTVIRKDRSGFIANGSVPRIKVIRGAGASTAQQAGLIADRELAFYSIPKLHVTLVMSREVFGIKPGDVFKWTWPQYTGVSEFIMRVLATDYGSLNDGRIVVTCTRDPFDTVYQPFVDPPIGAPWTRATSIQKMSTQFSSVSEAPLWFYYQNLSLGGSLGDGNAKLVHLAGADGEFHAGYKTVTALPGAAYAKELQYGQETPVVQFTPVARLSSPYASTTAVYDTTTGIIIDSMSDPQIMSNKTEDEIRNGANILKIGDEYLAYETVTDLGGGSYKLENIWRALLDTVKLDHLPSEAVWFMNGYGSVTDTLGRLSYSDEDIVEITQKAVAQGMEQTDDETVTESITLNKRGQRPVVPDGIFAYAAGYDRISGENSIAELSHAENQDDNTETVHTAITGQDQISNDSDMGKVYTNDLRMTWKRRDRLSKLIVRGDDDDIQPNVDDLVQYRIEGKLADDSDWTLLSDYAAFTQSKDKNTTAYGYAQRGLVGCGNAKIRVMASRVLPDTPALDSLNTYDIDLELVSYRQLLLNRKCIPYWDIGDSLSTAPEYGTTRPFDPYYSGNIPYLGSLRKSIRGWQQVSKDGPVIATVGRNLGDAIGAMEVKYYQFYYGTFLHMDASALPSGDDDPGIVQTINLPYSDATGHVARLSWYGALVGSGNSYTVNLRALDASGTVLSTATTTVSTLTTNGYAKKDLTLSSIPSGTVFLQVAALFANPANVTANDDGPALSNFDLRLAPKIGSQLLSNNGFASGLTSWTQATGTWSASIYDISSTTGLNKEDDFGFIVAPAYPTVAAILTQTQNIPADFNAGDVAHLRWWSQNVEGDDTNQAKIEILDSGSSVLATFTSDAISYNQSSVWHPRELYAELPAEADKIKVSLIAASGPALGEDGEPDVILDFTEPVVQTFSSPNATHEYLLTETSGDYADTGYGIEAPIDTFVTGSQGQPAPGIWDGSSYDSQVAWETTTTTSSAAVSDSSAFDSNDTDLYVRLFFRVRSRPAAALTTLASKRDGANAGWEIMLSNTGVLSVTIEDTSANSKTVTLTGDHADGGLHYVEFFYDDSANEIVVNSDLDNGNSLASASPIAATLSNSSTFRLGDPTGGNAAPQYYQAVAVLCGEDAAAQLLYDETGWWTHASDPTGELTTQTSTSVLGLPVSGTKVAHFSPNTVPIGFDTNLANSNKLGVFFPWAQTNLCTASEDLTHATWTPVNTTPVKDAATSPDGFITASKLSATADNGYIYDQFSAVASADYTLSFYLKGVASGETGRLVFYDVTGASELGSTAFTATDDWDQRIELTVTTTGAITAQMRIEIDTNGEEIYVWGTTIERADGVGAYAYTDGSGTATIALPVFTAANVLSSEIGSMAVQALQTSSRLTHVLCSTESTTDLRKISHITGTIPEFRFNDGSASSWMNTSGSPLAINSSRSYLARWDTTDSGLFSEDTNRSGAGHVDTATIGTPVTTSATFSDSLRDLKLGVSEGGVNGWNGFIERVHIYHDVVVSDPSYRGVAFDDIDLRCYKTDARKKTFDFSSPYPYTIPATRGAIITASQSPKFVPYEIWNCQEASGDLIGTIRGVPLTGIVARQGAPAYGIDLANGEYDLTKKCLEFTEVAESKRAPAIDDVRFTHGDTTSFGGLLWARAGRRTTTTRSILGQRDATNPCWELQMLSNGNLKLYTHDGTAATEITLGGNHDTGAWFLVGYVVDRTNNQLRLYSSLGATATPVSIAGRTAFEATDVAFGLGENSTVPAFIQIRQFAYLEDVSAETLSQTIVDNLWGHASDPTGEIDVLTRTGVVVAPIAAASGATTAPSEIACCFSDEASVPDLPIGHSSTLGSLGLFSEVAQTNRCIHGELLSNWTDFDCTVTDNAAEGPEGMYNASHIVQTDLDGGIYLTDTGATSSADHYLTFWARNTTGGDFFVSVRNQADTANIAGGVLIGSTDWRFYTLAYTTDPGQTSVKVIIASEEPDVQTFDVALVSFVEGPLSRLSLPTLGSTESMSATVQELQGTSNQWVVSAEGTIRATFATHEQLVDDDRTIYHFEGDSGNNDAALMQLESGESWVTQSYWTGSGSVAASMIGSAVGANKIYTASSRWSSRTSLTGSTAHATLKVNTTPVVTSTGTWTAGAGVFNVHVGSDKSGAKQLQGIISKIEVWKGDVDL